ncbi:MAG: hypothetical protein HRT86_14925 [Ilumatobacteraceae bacterium]|nr:hypothetical protein [Ilumatobacteraceae bacterium]
MNIQTSVIVRVPDRTEAEYEALDESLLALGDRHRSIEYDGTGSDGTSIDYYLYGNQPEAVIEAVLGIDWPWGTVADVEVRDLAERSTTSYHVDLFGDSKGTTTTPTTQRSKLKAGDWFLYPFEERSDLFVLARVSHLTPHQMLMHLYAEPRPNTPSTDELVDTAELGPDDAIAHVLFDPTMLDRGKWPWLGPAGPFDIAEWPLPEFEVDFLGKHHASAYTDGLGSKRTSRELAETEWWTLSPLEISGIDELDGIVARALNDPPNRYRMPPRAPFPPP